MHTTFLSIGSNIGNGVDNIRKALDLIGRHEKIKIVKMSHLYKTEPWGNTEQAWFVNCIAKVETSLPVEIFFEQLKKVEAGLGRKHVPESLNQGKNKRYAPRLIDIDILFFGDTIVNYDALIIPHPLLHERAFVLIPFLDIDPLFVHPVLNRSISEMISGLKDKKKVLRFEDT
ncbi:MAG: 2-amino-4-hydroxy-6-hydroxymethyldihydropteridine diphosphokinase [Deltaproteobacteria bacterium GWC2_42_11]|nr:MAG: 2-amino-4-hydroxy-6-hydroxymethyldihydropteridine diphosphokinase [Deltaproteobacteria bacterium GWC2_42_11]HBO83658.1 2-amino-4-hydroxy-6-hydroxymethyldihydropteridine diphosphokinase [Deltaproteobacteria bacterium]